MNRKKVLVRVAKSWRLGREPTTQKSSTLDNVKDNEDGDNPTGMGKVITERPGLKE